MAIVIDGSGSITGISAGGLPDSSVTTDDIASSAVTVSKIDTTVSQLFGMRNRIINGDMGIDQRNAGASVTPINLEYTVDRWAAGLTQASKFSVQQNAAAVTPPVGFSNYLGVTSLSSYSVLAGDIFLIRQYIEGYNFADLGWGTANAKTITLSFWVRSSLTGTFGGSLMNSASNRSYPFTYSISVANTWEQKSVTIAGDTSGTWIGATNGIGVRVFFGLGGGATYSGTAGAWAASAFYTATGATSVVGTNAATFYITGVQLEVGSTATPFERRLYNQELANCQRYFCLLAGGGACGVAENTNTVSLTYQYPVPMRTSPTGTLDATKGTLNQPQSGPNAVTTMNSFSFGTATSETGGWLVLATSTTPFTNGRVIINAGTTGMIKFSAEL